MTHPQPLNDSVRVRVPVATVNALKATGAPISVTVRQALDFYLAHPALKTQTPKPSDKVTTS